MRRVLLIAKRDYLQTVLSKAYIIGLVLVPILIGASFLATSLAFRGNAKDQHVAIIDRTGVAASAVIQAAEETSRRAVAKAPGGLNVMPHIVFEQVQPEADQTAQLLSLSDRIRRGELVLVLDISAGALAPGKEDPPVDLVRIYSNSSGVDQVGIAMQSAVNDGLRRVRLSQLGIDPARFPDILRDVPVVSMALVTKDPVSKLADLIRDAAVIETARRAVTELLALDPELSSGERRELRRLYLRRYGEREQRGLAG